MRAGWQPASGPEALLSQGAAELDGLRDLSAEARVTIAGAEGKGTGTAFIIYQPPSRFRVDIRGPLFRHLLTAVMDGDSLLIQAQGQVWRGTVGGGMLSRLVDIDIGTYHLPYALLGVVQPGRLDTTAPPEYTRADRAVATVQDSGLCRRVWVDLFRGFATREEVLAGGEVDWGRKLDEYRRVGSQRDGVYLPRRVKIVQADRSLELRYGRYAVNEGIDEGSFRRGISAAGE